MNDDKKTKIWSYAFRLIKVRKMSRYTLETKLTQKYPDDKKEIQNIIEEMVRVYLIDDKKYTEQLIHHLIQKPIGRLKVYNECRKRGLAEELVEHYLGTLKYNEEEMAEKAVEQKLKTLNEMDERRQKQKLMTFLRGRGFTNAAMYSAINKIRR